MMLQQGAIALSLMSLTTLVLSCSASKPLAATAQAQAEIPSTLEPYGADGTLTTAEVATLQGLAWPQTYADITGTFGFPYARTEAADFFQTPDGQWAVIYYSGTTATGYGMIDSPLP